MAFIKKFKIDNFKGIESLEVNMLGRHKCPVITLVGLNESGKTTILEAISHFLTNEGTISEGDEGNKSSNYLSLVPIAKKANFSGKISISATVQLEQADKEAVIKIFNDQKLELKDDSLPEEFEITRNYLFKDGQYIKLTNNWGLNLFCKNKRAQNFKEYQRPDDSSDEKDLWLASVNAIKATLPTIAYFPTFLVDVPSRIYLEPYEGEHASQRYYRDVLQDVLDSLGDGLDLQKHVVKRIKDYQENENNPNWFSMFLGKPEKGQVDSVIQKISSSISKEVIGSWRNIFSRPISAKMIVLDWHVDLEKNGIPYISISISDGESRYALHERSLGFRWFFLFLLFTRFKRDKERPTLFLFDEPAANLHARAQIELLTSFEKILGEKNTIIYSTHSTHMINPRWVPASHIVENTAINYDSEDETATFSSPPTSILAHPYRTFVSENPDRTSYFQPIMERLEDVTPLISPNGPVIVTEGISDFHAYSYYCADLMKKEKVGLVPGLGDASHDILISGMIGKGQNFIIILDDDNSGKRGANRYRENWILDNRSIATVGELNPEHSGKKLETLLSEDTRKNICAHFGKKSDQPSKKEIALYFAEANAGLINDKSSDTEKIFIDLLSEAINRLKT